MRHVTGWTIVLSTLVLELSASSAWSESVRKPAVSRINGSVMGYYAGSYQSEIPYLFGPEHEWNNTGGVAASAYLPVGSRLGLALSGGGRWGSADDWTSWPAYVTTARDLGEFTVGADLFWRDPDSGFVGLFYDYTRTRIEYSGSFEPRFVYPVPSTPTVPYRAIRSSDLSDLRLAGGIYVGEFDVELDGGYERVCSAFSRRGPASNEICANGYGFGTTVAAYPGESDQIRVEFGLGGGNTTGQNPGRVLGAARIDWQPHFFGNRYVRLGGSVGGGAQFVANQSQPFVTVGLSLSIDLPGADNLKQLFREMQI